MKIITASNGKSTFKMIKVEWNNIGKKAGWIKLAMEELLIFNKTPIDGFFIPINEKYANLLKNIYGVDKIQAEKIKKYQEQFKQDGFTIIFRNPEEIS